MKKLVHFLNHLVHAFGRLAEETIEANGTGRAYLATYGQVSLTGRSSRQDR